MSATVTTWSDVQAATAAEEAALRAYVEAEGTDRTEALAAWEAADEAQLNAVRRYKADRAAGLVGPS